MTLPNVLVIFQGTAQGSLQRSIVASLNGGMSVTAVRAGDDILYPIAIDVDRERLTAAAEMLHDTFGYSASVYSAESTALIYEARNGGPISMASPNIHSAKKNILICRPK